MSQSIELNNGVTLSNICCGTPIVYFYNSKSFDLRNSLRNLRHFKNKQLKKDLVVSKVIDIAFRSGCKLFDTSRAYDKAEFVLGQQLKKYDRNEYKIVTKLCNKDQYSGDIEGALNRSLYELGVDYVDVYLMHWPVTNHFLDNWRKMEELYEKGLCKAIGVCNCNIHHLEAIESIASITPMINQIECHPLFTQNELRKYCKENNIQVMAYTSTARMNERLNKTCLVPIAKKYDKSIAQIILRWHQQIGNIPIVSSSNVKHMIDNICIDDFSLTEDEIEAILRININSRLRYDPDNCDFSQL